MTCTTMENSVRDVRDDSLMGSSRANKSGDECIDRTKRVVIIFNSLFHTEHTRQIGFVRIYVSTAFASSSMSSDQVHASTFIRIGKMIRVVHNYSFIYFLLLCRSSERRSGGRTLEADGIQLLRRVEGGEQTGAVTETEKKR